MELLGAPPARPRWQGPAPRGVPSPRQHPHRHAPSQAPLGLRRDSDGPLTTWTGNQERQDNRQSSRALTMSSEWVI